MMTLNTETQQKIIASAEKLFYQKGKAGTSMQDIADDAGINRTLLNYYFRSKDLLFEAVFRKALGNFVPTLATMLHSDMPFGEYIPHLIHTVIDTMLDNPQIPIFVLQELSSNPDRMPHIIKEMGIDPDVAFKKIEAEEGKGAMDEIEFKQLIINLLSLCIFPFASRPVITEILFNGDNHAFIAAMKQRREFLPKMFLKLMNQKQ